MPQQRSGVTARSLPPTESRPDQVPGLGQALGVEDHLALGAQVLAGLLDGGDVALPGDVHVGVVLGRLDDHPQLAQRLDDLDAERPDRDVAPVDQRRRRAHDVLGAAQAHVEEGVDHAEVRVLAEAEDGEPVVVARVHVEVVAVVEVAVAGGGVRNELGRLVDRVVVARGEGHARASAAGAAAAAAAGHGSAAHAGRLGGQSGGGEDGQQAPGAHVTVGTGGGGVGLGHGAAVVEDGLAGRAAEFVERHGPQPRWSGSARAERRRRSARRCTSSSRRAGTARRWRRRDSRSGRARRHRPRS